MPSDPTADPEQSAPDRRLVLAAATAARLAPRRDEAPPPEDWRRVVTAIRTYRWLVIAVTGVGTLAGIIGARFLKPTYQARATVWLEIPDQSAHERDQGPFQSGQLLGTATGWLDLLRSHVVLDDVVRQWRLYLKPQSAADSAALATLTVTGDVRPGRYRLQVAAAAERFVAAAADLKRQRLTELTAILKDQLDRAETNLRAAERGLTAFRVRNAVRPSEGPAQGPDGRRITADPTFASYVDLQVALGALAHDREAIARVVAHAADSGVAVDQLAMISAVQHASELTAALKELSDRQAELRVMRFRYADTHPPVRRLAQQVDTLARRVIPELGRAVVAGLAAREHELQQRIDSISRDLRSAPPVALEEVRLEIGRASCRERV